MEEQVTTKGKTDDGTTEDPDGKTADKTADEGDKNGGGGGADSGSLEQRIREVVREAIDSLLGDGAPTGKRTAATDEDEIERRVRSAQEKLKKEEEANGRLSKVEETLSKVVETPPSRNGLGGKIQRFMWGDDAK